MLKRLSVTGVAAVAIFATTTVTNASAATSAGCSVTGASGSLTFTNWSSHHVDISGWIKDTAADGHHVAIRFTSVDGYTGWVTEWPWHSNYNGNGTTVSFTTYANSSGDALDYIGAQVAVIEGSTIVRYCNA